jgi:acid phosphatase
MLVVPFGYFATAAIAPPHVLIVLMENTSYEQIVGNSQMPFVNAQVATNGSVSTADLSHPSLPNYLGLVSGSIQNNPADTTPQDGTYPGPQFTDELANAGIGWKAYMQDMPVACDLTDQFGPGGYDVNHNPFMYFNSVRTNSSQCNRVVPYPQLTTDLNAGTAPPFLWVSPNLTNDMHDGTAAQGDIFLQGLVTQVRASSWWTSDSRIIITWDEGETTEQVLTLVIGSPHGTAATGGNEYGTLRGLEEVYGVGLLGHSADANVGDILPLLTAAAPPSPSPSPIPSPSPSTSPIPSPSASQSPSPSPSLGPSSGTRGIFRFTSTDFAAMHTAGFNAATDGGAQDNGVAEAANGITGMVWVDAYDNTTCAQTMTNTQIAAMVQANVIAGHQGLRYEIGDEPTANGCNAAPVYTSITQAVHGADPTAKTWVISDQFQVGNPVQPGVPMKGSVDILAFDVYPCESGPCDYSAIDSAVQQIHAANITTWEFVIQDFSSPPWRWPTPAEIQGQFDHWKNQGAIGYWVFAWDYLGAQVIQQPGNITALQSINSQAFNGSPSPSPSPSPSTLSVSVGASVSTGSAPLGVSFTSTPSGGLAPYSYAWTFGDGAGATSQNPNHTYTVAGTYSANLTVTDAHGATAIRSSLIVTVQVRLHPQRGPHH